MHHCSFRSLLGLATLCLHAQNLEALCTAAHGSAAVALYLHADAGCTFLFPRPFNTSSFCIQWVYAGCIASLFCSVPITSEHFSLPQEENLYSWCCTGDVKAYHRDLRHLKAAGYLQGKLFLGSTVPGWPVALGSIDVQQTKPSLSQRPATSTWPAAEAGTGRQRGTAEQRGCSAQREPLWAGICRHHGAQNGAQEERWGWKR